MRRLADGVVLYTQSQARELAEADPATRTFSAPNAIYRAAEMAAARSTAVPSSFIYVGRLVPAKKPDVLLKAFICAQQQSLPDSTRLVLVGDGPMMASLRAEATRSMVADRVEFHGHVSDTRALRKLYATAIASVSPGFVGLSLTQSLGFGVPMIIARDEPHAPEIEAAREGWNSIMYAPSTSESLASALVAMARERDNWYSRRDEISRDCRESYSAEAMARGFLSAAEAVGRRDRAERPRHGWPQLAASLACPLCRAPLTIESLSLSCRQCGRKFPVADGIPVLVPEQDLSRHDEIDHHAVAFDGDKAAHTGHKAAQADHFNRALAEEFEIDRPNGEPRLYRFLLNEKFRRAVDPIRAHLVEASALAVCGGSGMDANFIANAGAVVISSDLSFGASKRAKVRSKRYGLGFESIVADVEHLPFADKSLDLVAVHDGLHHLQDPYAGLSEMARVARRWVVVTEPARASITLFAIHLGLALEREEAGNRVARLQLAEVTTHLEARGFAVLRADRYAMYYPHRPGVVFKLLSLPGIYPVACVGWRIANALIGRFGNKMVVVAERLQPSETGRPPSSTDSPTRSTGELSDDKWR